MGKKEQILNMYYMDHSKQKDIASVVEVAPQYVSKVVKADSRYEAEKEYRKGQNAEQRKLKVAIYVRKHRSSKFEDMEYQRMLLLQEVHALDMSYKPHVSDINYGKWNSSIYSYTRSGNLKLNKSVNVSKDVPKYIKMNKI